MTKRDVSFNVRLENDPTKDEEVQLVEKFRSQFDGSNSYLEMFFSENMRDYLVQMIRNDFAPDLMKDYKEALDSVDMLNAQVEKAHEENDLLKKGLTAKNEMLQDDYSALAVEKNQLAEIAVNHEERLGDMTLYTSEVNKKLRDKSEKLVTLEFEMMRLKARLFDLEFALEQSNEEPKA